MDKVLYWIGWVIDVLAGAVRVLGTAKGKVLPPPSEQLDRLKTIEAREAAEARAREKFGE